MTNLKDKLSASVRQAKAAQTPAAKSTAAKAAPAAAKTASKPAARKVAAKRAAKPAAPATPAPTVRNLVVHDPVSPKVTVSNSPVNVKTKTSQPVRIAAGGIAESSNQLFPQRIWPD